MIKTQIYTKISRGFVLCFVLISVYALLAQADEFTSSSFKVLEPVLQPAGYSTSSGYTLIGTIAQLAIGTSTAAAFNLSSGFLFFPFASSPVVTATAGNAQVSLSWTASTGLLGWTVSGYNVGVNTASSSDPFTYTSLGNVTSSIRTGLTNGTRYFFVIRAQDAFGNSVASSSVISSVPTTATTFNAESFSFASGGTFTMNISGGINCTFTMPANFYTENLDFRAFAYPKSEFETAKPPPSGKNFAGNVFDFNFHALDDSAQVTSLSAAVSVSCTYTDADVSGIQESSLKFYRRGGSDTSWTEISGATLDVANNNITFSTQNFSSFGLIGDPVSAPAPAPTPTSSGGGGGGGGILFQSTRVVIKGRAYPNANIVIFKDGTTAATPKADQNGNFSTELEVASGIYTFSLYAIDSSNRRSLTTSFTTNVSGQQTTTISDVVIAPTIGADKAQVKFGNDIKFFGSSYPTSVVNVIINSDTQMIDKVSSDKFGLWLYTLNSNVLEMGGHTTKSQTVTPDSIISPFSESLAFAVGNTDILAGKLIGGAPPRLGAAPAACNKNGDINSDGKVNIVDFSIMLFFWNQSSPKNSCADTNGDGVTNIFDFSIMLFWWSG